MRFTRLKHVVEVDRYGSITAAASRLNTTQSTVTKSVAAMEQDLGFALFTRRTRGVVATDKGREFIDRASRILYDYERLVDDSRKGQDSANALLRIGVCPALLQGLFNRAVCGLVEARPDIRIQLQAIPIERGVRLLHRGDVDLLIGPLDILSSEHEFKLESIPSIEAGLYVRKGHKLANKKDVTGKDIWDYPVITTDPLNPYSEELMQIAREVDPGDPMRRFHLVNYFPLIARMVLSSDAVSVISKAYAQSRAFKDKFKLLDIDLFEPLSMCCAWRSRWLPTRSARLFIANLMSSD